MICDKWRVCVTMTHSKSSRRSNVVVVRVVVVRVVVIYTTYQPLRRTSTEQKNKLVCVETDTYPTELVVGFDEPIYCL